MRVFELISKTGNIKIRVCIGDNNKDFLELSKHQDNYNIKEIVCGIHSLKDFKKIMSFK